MGIVRISLSCLRRGRESGPTGLRVALAGLDRAWQHCAPVSGFPALGALARAVFDGNGICQAGADARHLRARADHVARKRDDLAGATQLGSLHVSPACIACDHLGRHEDHLTLKITDDDQ